MKAEVKKKTNYKPVNFSESDWNEYKALAEKIEAETGYRVSIPALVRKAMNVFKESM